MNDDKLLVVLASSEPKLREHNRALFNGVEVQVIESAMGKMTYLPDKTEESRQDVQFWRVQLPNTAESPSWVAQWCVQPVAAE
jgi:hypothetical protein